jgi:hypothetical protein
MCRTSHILVAGVHGSEAGRGEGGKHHRMRANSAWDTEVGLAGRAGMHQMPGVAAVTPHFV